MPKKKLGNILNLSTSNVPYVYLAVGDIGSNGIRFLLASARRTSSKSWTFKREQAMRLPVRLGADVFSDGCISQENIARLRSAMRLYRELLELYQPYKHSVCATSALRESDNMSEIVQTIKEDCQVRINVIDGIQEARYIHKSLAVSPDRPEALQNLHIDVGGGSTELIFGTDKRITGIESLSNGTIRRTREDCSKVDRKLIRNVKKYAAKCEDLAVTASGGNARQLYKLIGANWMIDARRLKVLHRKMKVLDVNKLMKKYSLRQDRAETITQATEIYLMILEAAGQGILYTPRANLIGGILESLGKQIKSSPLE